MNLYRGSKGHVCQSSNVKNVPPNTVIRSNPVFVGSVYGGCSGPYCRPAYGPYYGADITSYDANASLRQEYYRRCIESKGYTVAELPQCRANQLPPGFNPTLGDKVNRPGSDA